MSPITTHVLDTAGGKPAEGIAVHLSRASGSGWQALGDGTTNADGRVTDLLAEGSLEPGTYRLKFQCDSYFPDGFYPFVEVTFHIKSVDQHYHVPILLSPFGYSTYRGS